MMSKTVLFVQLPLVTKPRPSAEEQSYYAAYWQAMARAFDHEFPSAQEAYTIPELPLWVTRLAAIAVHAGWSPRFVDFARFTGPRSMIPVSAMAGEIASLDAPVICLSPFTANYEVAVELTCAIKRLQPDTLVVVGGAHASELAETCAVAGFDYVVRGRGEAPLLHLLTHAAAGRPPDDGFPGLVSRFVHSSKAVPEDRSLFEALWQLPAEYDVIPASYPMHFARAYATLGCPYRCSFCADTLWIAMRPYQRDLVRLRDELFALKHRFNPAVLFVGDEVFTMNQAYCAQVIELLGEVGIPWFCQTRANLLIRSRDKHLIASMAKAGCKLVNIGAESTDAQVLHGLEKKVTTQMLQSACETVKENDLAVLTYWMVGGPGETERSAVGTLADIGRFFSAGLTDIADYFICTPYPGTALFRNPQQYGVSIAEKPWRFWREDIPSVMSTESLSAHAIYELWLNGLADIAQWMYNSPNRALAEELHHVS